MQVNVRNVEGFHVVSVEGELTLLTSGVFFSRIVDLRREPGTRIVLDLHGLTFLDSSGVAQVWKTVECAREEGGDVVLACVPAFVRKILETVGISGAVVMAESVDDAVKSLVGKGGRTLGAP